jgi:hypothetical protein
MFLVQFGILISMQMSLLQYCNKWSKLCFGAKASTFYKYLKNHSSESISQRLFDLVHSDIWGPAPFVPKGGHKYYIIFMYNFSHRTWIYFIKNCSGSLSIYKTFFVMVHTYFDTYIGIFHADFA